MTAKQGEWKYGVYIASPEEAHKIWKKKREYSQQVCLRANKTCECCYRNTDITEGSVHHRNGDKQDFSHQNIIWLCECCYIQVNGLNRGTGEITISKLRSELT